MALIKCPECGKEISSLAVACPNCGIPIAGVVEVKAIKKVPVTFWREKKYGGSAINAVVSVDEKRVGSACNGDSFTIDLAVGKHIIVIESSLSHVSYIDNSVNHIGDNTTSSRVSNLDIPESAKSVRIKVGLKRLSRWGDNAFIDVLEIEMK